MTKPLADRPPAPAGPGPVALMPTAWQAVSSRKGNSFGYPFGHVAGMNVAGPANPFFLGLSGEPAKPALSAELPLVFPFLKDQRPHLLHCQVLIEPQLWIRGEGIPKGCRA
jgi:hypothetical protein